MNIPRQKKPVSSNSIWFLLTLLLVIGVVVYFSYQIKDLQYAIAYQKTTIIRGINGLNGKDGTNGIQGIQGVNAVSTNTIVEHDTTTTVVQQQPIQGPTGEQGQAGADGRTIYLQFDPSSGVLQYKYDGDRFWSDVSVGSSND